MAIDDSRPNPLDSLHRGSARGGGGAVNVLGVAIFLYLASSVVVHLGLTVLDAVLPVAADAPPACILVEGFAACFLLDLVSGIWHSVLDLSDMGERLRCVHGAD
eukprot:1685681-Prymnesium_polylepis.1